VVKGDDGTIYLTLKDLAERWGVSPETIRRQADGGEIPWFNAGGGELHKFRRFLLADVERVEQERRERSPE